MRKRSLCIFAFLCACVAAAFPQPPSDPDADYLARFETKFPKISPAPTLAEYATQKRFDELYMGEARLDQTLAKANNDKGGLAWGLSYLMSAYNEMRRATGDTKYLDANLRCALAVMAARDDKTGKTLAGGAVAPIWGSEGYAEGRAAFVVHTGVIASPILDFLLEAEASEFFAMAHGDDLARIAKEIEASVAYHDAVWRDGPAEGEGHYIALGEEKSIEGKPQPGNRLSAMGRALWLLWKLKGDERRRDQALKLGRYMKARFVAAPDGAYYWSYSFTEGPAEPAPRESVKGEDASHGALTAAFPIMLGEAGEVFTKDDLARFGKTALLGFARREDGVLFGDVTGSPASKPDYVQIAGRWLALAPHAPEVAPRVARFFLERVKNPSPLDLAMLIRFAK